MQEIINTNNNIKLIEKIVEMNQNITTLTIIDKLPNKEKASQDKIYLKLCFSCRDFFLFTGTYWLLIKHEEIHDECSQCKRKGTLNCNKEIARNIND